MMSLTATFLDQPLPWLAIALAIFAAWLMGFARSGLGTGGFVVSPLMILALGATNGLAVAAVLMLPAGAIGVWQHRGEAGWDLLKPLLIAAVVGTAIGAALLWLIVSAGELNVIHRRLEVVVACLSLFYVALVVWREPIANLGGGAGPPRAPGTFLAGTLLGISQTVANSGAPLMTIYFLRHKLTKERFVAAQLDFLLVQNLLKLLPLIGLGLLHLGNAGAALLLFPLVLLGNWSGQLFYKRASEKVFFALFTVLLVIGFCTSVALIVGRSRVLGFLGG
ncbi:MULTISPECIES: TSUP family transporter [Thiorhodovibrio]|uniref:TSUP family transporter n=1 Tax=Thiorhodovibrio TaxID=61593 RepID=UPI001914247C|nr:MULTISPECIES: TSUP family transporter [Thiorhodovibrio]MBK5969930.1 hypothetical protein [Thiorhodovibrio winogradskyi]WPL12024.1 Sulfite exporter TauE/SafE [Thiorhodovibrio litoralis]